MTELRRKVYYIDRVFQRKFLILFLLLCFLGTAINILYMSTYLNKNVEMNLYRARYVISNVNAVIAEHVVIFNAVITAVMVVLAVCFYLLVRRRVQQAATRMKQALEVRTLRSLCTAAIPAMPEEFAELESALASFFAVVDEKLRNQRSALAAVHRFVDAPDNKTKHEALERLRQL